MRALRHYSGIACSIVSYRHTHESTSHSGTVLATVLSATGTLMGPGSVFFFVSSGVLGSVGIIVSVMHDLETT